jgi:hypothetical protein
LEFIHSADEIVNKTCNAPIPVRIGTPVICSEDCRYSNRGDPLSLGDEVWIVGDVEIRGKILRP